MLSYCFKCRKNTESKTPKVARAKDGRIKLLSKCVMCASKKIKIYQGVASGLLSSLGVKALLSGILLVGPVLF